MTACLYLIIIYSRVLLSSLTCASEVQRQNTKVRISAIGNTIILKFLEEDKIDTKLEGYIIGYGGSLFSKQVIQLPEDGEPYETEIDAEPKYLIAVQPFKGVKGKKQCAGKEILKKPLHLVIGSVTSTSVLLSWGTILNSPYTDANLDDCIEDGQFNVRYREKEPNKNWIYQTCPTAGTVIDHLKPETPYEFGVQAETDVDRGAWSHSVTHNTADIYIPENPVNMLRTKIFLSTKEPITEAPETNSPLLSTVQNVTQRRPASLIKQTATPVIPRKTLGTESDGFATSAPPEDLLFLTQAFTHTQMTLPPPTVIQRKPSDITMSQEQPHTTYFQLITEKPPNTLTKTASSTVTTKLETIQPETITFHSTDHSQSKSVPKSHTQPTPRKTKHKGKTTQKQPKTPQPQTTQFQPIPTTSKSQTTKSLSTTQSQTIAVKSQSKFPPKLKTTQKPQYITLPQTHSTISQLITIMSRPYTSQSQPSSTQTQSLTTQTQPSTTPSRPNTTVKQTKNPPKPTHFEEIYQTSSISQTSMSTMTYHHVPSQLKPIHKQPSFTLPQPPPIKKQSSETQSPMTIKNITVTKQPTLSYKQHFTQQSTYKMNPVSLSSHTFRTTVQNKHSPSTNSPLITATKDHFFTSVSTLSSTKANIQEESYQSLLSTTESSSQTLPSVTFHHQPFFQPTHPPTAHISSTTPKNKKTESTSVPHIPTGFYRATTHVLRVPKKHYIKVKSTAKSKGIQNSTLIEKKVVNTKHPNRTLAPRQSQDGKLRPNPIRVTGVKNKNKGNTTSFVRPTSGKTSTKTIYDEKHKGLLQPKPTKEPKKTLEINQKINIKVQQETKKEESKIHWDKNTDFKQKVPVPIVKPHVSSTTEKTVYQKPLPTFTPLFVLNGSRFDTGDNSSVFSALPSSDVDAMGEKRFVGPNVIYRTDKPPDEPCSVTKSLSFFPEEENMAINVTNPPKTPPANLTVVTVEGCPSFVILDWEKTDNATTEYDVTSSVKGTNGNEVSVITTNQTHTAVENLKPKSSYEFTVTPKNILGSGPTSEAVSFNTESADPRVSEIPTGKNAIWSSFPFKTDSYSECTGTMYVKRTWYRKFVGIQLCNSLRYKIYMSDSLKGKFYNIGDDNGFGEDHCQFVDSFLDGRTGGTLLPNELPTRQGFYRSFRQEPVKFGQIGGNTHINYVGWYECGVPIPGSW